MWETFGQTSPSLESIIQVASTGGFAAFCWYLICIWGPRKDEEQRNERKFDQERWIEERNRSEERWREERAEFLGYITHRDSRWLSYAENRDEQTEKLMKEFTQVMIRVEAMLLEAERKPGK